GEKAGNPIARANAERGECRRHRRDLQPELPVAQAPLPPALVPEDHGVPLAVVPEEVLGEVEPGSRKPARAELRVWRRHALEADADVVPGLPSRPLVGHHPAEAPDLGPEGIRAVDRPPI